MGRIKKPGNLQDYLEGSFPQSDLLGDYQSLYLGHATSDKLREKGSSGGVGTALFSFMLESGEVDCVINVGSSDKDPMDISYRASYSEEDLLKHSGSKYLFIPFGEFKTMFSVLEEKTCVVIVQPCHVEAVKKLRRKFPNIKYVFSFFCGFNIDRVATPYMVSKLKVDPFNVERIDYRGGDYPGGFLVETKDKKIHKLGKEHYEIVDLMYLCSWCSKCSYYMGEGADVVLGDAWLKEKPNLTAVIARSDEGDNLLKKALVNKKLKLFELDDQLLLRMHWHNLSYKKFGPGPFLKFMIWTFNKMMPRTLVPFWFLGFCSKIRRKFKIGVASPALKPVNLNEK